MSTFTQDIHHRTSTRLGQVVPDFIESEHPQFGAFLEAYYEFLEQSDDLPLTSTFPVQSGVVTVQSGNSTISGNATTFQTTLTVDQRMQVGGDIFRVRSIASNTQLVVYEVPVRTYFANAYSVETNRSTRQASGALRKLLTYRDVDQTLDDFEVYFRDTYLRGIPYGTSATRTILPKILEFYQSRGSEDGFRFLFRTLYGKEIDFTYPRDRVLCASDGVYERPVVLKLLASSVVGNAQLLETRTIVGLTSNARAYVNRAVTSYEGNAQVTTLFLDDVTLNVTTGDILLQSDNAAIDGASLSVTAFGVPPDGLPSVVYEYTLVSEDASGGEFTPGETVSTVPTNDPVAISGEVLGSVVGFAVTSGGSGYRLGDVVSPPAGFNGGYGASGRVSGFANTNITGVDVVDGGDGYYTGLSLVVDNSGTGGTGLAGYVSEVYPGSILLFEDVSANVAEDDTLAITALNDALVVTEYTVSREPVNYYEVGVSIADVLAANVALDAADWGGGNTASALYGLNLSSTISTISTNLTTLPLYVDGVQTAVGAVLNVAVTSVGSSYVLGAPTVGVATPTTPTSDVAGLLPLSVPFYTYNVATLVANVAVGQIGSIEMIAGGAAYSTGPDSTFTVNSQTSTSTTGSGAELGLVLSAVTSGQGRFLDSRGTVSSDRYTQSLEYYQPFSYVVTVEEDLRNFKDVVRRLVHPAGGLLLVRQTITSEGNLTTDAVGTSTGRIVGVPGTDVAFFLSGATLPVSVTTGPLVLAMAPAIAATPSVSQLLGQGTAASDLIYPYAGDTINGSSFIHFTAYSVLPQYSAYGLAAPGPSANSEGLGAST